MIGRTYDGARFVLYWLSGRSTASRTRKFLEDAKTVRIVPTVAGEPDALRHYVALSRGTKWTVAGNGDHVPAISDALERGINFLDAVRAQRAEPDPPLWTPRIVAAAETDRQGGDLLVGSACVSAADRIAEKHYVGVLAASTPGSALVLHTYGGSRDEVAISGIPAEVKTAPTVRAQVHEAWSALAPSLRVLVFAQSLDDPGTLIALDETSER